MDLSNHVILPREDFIELQTAAWDQPQLPVKDRFVNTVNTSIVFAALAGAVALGGYGWARAMDWREERAFQRRMRELEQKKALETKPWPGAEDLQQEPVTQDPAL